MKERPSLPWCSGGLLVVLVLVSASGCTTLPLAARPFTPPTEGDLRPHYVLAHEDGYPIETNREVIAPEEFSRRIKKILMKIDNRAGQTWPTTEKSDKWQPLRLLLFVHGGLNGPPDQFERMEELVLGKGGKEGVFPKTSYYPIFINWNSALGDSILDDLVFIRGGRRVARPATQVLGVISAPLVLAGRLIQSVFGAVPALQAAWDNFKEAWDAAREEKVHPKGAIVDAAGQVALLPLWALTTPGLQALGTPGWEIMQRRAQLLIASKLKEDPKGVGQGTARALIEELRKRLVGPDKNERLEWRIETGERYKVTGPVEITLVGHSMGALIVNRILAMARPFPVRRIVYLAAASTIDELEELAFPYVEQRRKDKYETDLWAFTLSRLREAQETSFVDLLPRGTLLVWVDQYLEPVKTIGQQRFGRWKGYKDYFPDQKWPGYIKIISLDHRLPGAPTHHGDFDNAEFFERILCTVDDKAFLNESNCKDKKYPLPG